MVVAVGVEGGLAGKSGAFRFCPLFCTVLLCHVGFILSRRSLVLTLQVGARSLSFERRLGGLRKRFLFLAFQQQTLVVVYLEVNKNNMCPGEQHRYV